MFLLGLSFVAVASGVSLLWIYTGGHLDQKSIERALPLIRKDVDLTLINVSKRTEAFYADAAERLGPMAKTAEASAKQAWKSTKKFGDSSYKWASKTLGPSFDSGAAKTKELWLLAQAKVQEFWAWLKPQAWQWWLWARPHFQKLGEVIIERVNLIAQWLETNLPVYYEAASVKAAEAWEAGRKAYNSLVA